MRRSAGGGETVASIPLCGSGTQSYGSSCAPHEFEAKKKYRAQRPGDSSMGSVRLSSSRHFLSCERNAEVLLAVDSSAPGVVFDRLSCDSERLAHVWIA